MSHLGACAVGRGSGTLEWFLDAGPGSAVLMTQGQVLLESCAKELFLSFRFFELRGSPVAQQDNMSPARVSWSVSFGVRLECRHKTRQGSVHHAKAGMFLPWRCSGLLKSKENQPLQPVGLVRRRAWVEISASSLPEL